MELKLDISNWLVIGGSPQGSFIGQQCYTTGSHDNAEGVEEENKYQYIDDLSILEILFLANVLIDYDFHSDVASDIGIDQRFLPPESTQTEVNNRAISLWTEENKMKLNTDKSSYLIFTRMKENLASRMFLDKGSRNIRKSAKVMTMSLEGPPPCIS